MFFFHFQLSLFSGNLSSFTGVQGQMEKTKMTQSFGETGLKAKVSEKSFFAEVILVVSKIVSVEEFVLFSN